ncbi:Putative SH3 domain, VHS domain, SH3-like domain superfamily protein [Septoria linicola]|uniref:Class E vacuolar protein-sorting machinery protein HSE1 n=1 Tax=Septoria linicola TaxID=215465 RepID=A0A9Q9AFS2_9PEZI|nr:putative SH3 domain, VHS domain, SH3-like domain superfamily protein [Septoria linicola]USW48275.1 Putative SH3 domain, VHS domain, SH3-like domain superfamily protein [Septoria linicola]
MFRAQSSPMDDAVVKATDENLTSENWEYILDVCDRVSANSSGPAQATAALIKRLAHRNANVQLYTLELANALSQNCGLPLHRELASKAFTEALLRLAGDRTTHAQVKQKVLERMSGWSDEFRSSPELGIMEQAYQKLRTQQPGLMPPSKPTKKEISGDDRRKEEEELQMALALSIKDKGPANGMSQTGGKEEQQASAEPQSQPAAPQGTTAATVSRVRALYDFTPSEPGELAFRKNDIIAVLESVYKDWWKGSLRGQTGIFPLNYVEKLQDPTKEELERDAQMEAEVFGEIKSVEKLLALLSVGAEGGGRRGEREEEEISELYQRTLGIRPKLIELIARYSQKKDDFTQLNEKFIKARRDYEALLESSMSQPQYHQQQYPVRSRPPPQFQQHQQPPYGGPQAPPQGYPGTSMQSSQAPPQNFAQSQQHLPPQQDPQRFYSPAPAEQPPAQQPGFSSPYPQQNGPPPSAAGGAAPFHFIPGGVPPSASDVRRKPSPNATPSGPYDAYNAGQGFQGQIRPNSIHTLNSGNPQELATGCYESPVDNRQSYPSAQMAPPAQQPPVQTYNAYPPQQQQFMQSSQPLQQPNVSRDDLSRQRTQSFESPTSLYSAQPDAQFSAQQQPPPQPHAAPPGVPTSPGLSQGQAPYQAYQPQQPPGISSGTGGGGNDADPGDFYR